MVDGNGIRSLGSHTCLHASEARHSHNMFALLYTNWYKPLPVLGAEPPLAVQVGCIIAGWQDRASNEVNSQTIQLIKAISYQTAVVQTKQQKAENNMQIR